MGPKMSEPFQHVYFSQCVCTKNSFFGPTQLTYTHTHTTFEFFLFQGGRSVVDRAQSPKSQTHHTLQATHKRLVILLSSRRRRHRYLALWCRLDSNMAAVTSTDSSNQSELAFSLVVSTIDSPIFPSQTQPHFRAKSGLNFLPSFARQTKVLFFPTK